MPNRALIYRTTTLTNAAESGNNTETVVATLAGVTCEYDGSTVRLHAWIKVTTGTGTTGGILRIRRDSLTGTAVSEATSETGPFVASKTFDASVSADDTGRTLAGGTYVLTHQGAGDTGVATYLAVELTAEVF
ncbi:MAG TPA: hypothetical protein VFO15_17990 [Xanthobacteraceae bacterium]|nr:hypothetical protein [Xanthobacteraceae bacterium]